jgi:hypothetical protein
MVTFPSNFGLIVFTSTRERLYRKPLKLGG